MEREPIDVIRDAIDAFNRHDWTALEQLLDPAIRAVDQQAPIGLADQVASRAEYLKASRGWAEAFENARVIADDYKQFGDQVVCSARYCGTGKGSGIPTEQRQFDVYRIANGVIVEALLGWRTLDEAIAATES